MTESHAAGWLVDGHVHLHEGFSLADSFTAAAGHFTRAATRAGLTDAALGCLLLAETEGEALFRTLQGRAPGHIAGPWSVAPTAEASSLLVRQDGRAAFALVAGRQVRTDNRIEVLAFGSAEPLPDGGSVERTIEHAVAGDRLAVVPWGFGKWWLRRGARLARLVRDAEAGTFFLGDNGGRPRGFPPPPLLRLARRRGIWNLPGSDPLPLASEGDRPGSYGFIVPLPPDTDRPFAQIRRFLARTDAQPRLFGRRAGVVQFARAQAAIR